MRPPLRGFPVFDLLTDADLAILDRVMVAQSFKSGHTFFREGDVATAVTASMHVVLEGAVEVVARAPEGGFGVRRTMGPGSLFGLVAFVTDLRRTASVRAAGPVRTARLDRRSFDELYKRQAGVQARFQIAIATQLAADIRTTGALLTRALKSGDVDPIVARFGTGG